MTNKQIKGWIKEAHENAIDKGFYDCHECEGTGIIADMSVHCNAGEPVEVCEEKDCSLCNGSGIDPNKNIGELLMLIVLELGEALEAHRGGRFPDYKKYEFSIEEITADMKSDGIILRESAVAAYGECIKDTFEDEIADVFIGLFDLCGYLNLCIPENITNVSGMIRECMSNENIGECLFLVTGQICKIQIASALSTLLSFCVQKNIPIEKHIDAKMVYNKTRAKLHGKKY